MTLLNLATMAGLLACAAVIGWAAVGTHADRPTRASLDVLERSDHDDA